MRTTRHVRFALVVSSALLMAALAGAPLTAQTSDSARLDRLRRDVQTELRRVDAEPTAYSIRVRDQLEDLRDDVGYLRVQQRRGQTIQDREFRDLEVRLQNLRRDLRTTETRPGVGGPIARGSGGSYEIPVGTEFDVRLQEELNSETAVVEDRFEAITVVDLYENERLLVPAGSIVRGVVSSVDRASRTDRRGSLTVSFDQITVRGRTYNIRANVVEALDAGVRGEVGKIGTGAGIGGILGGILGGTKGAIAGILIGAGGTVLATEGSDVKLPVGTIIRARMESPVSLPSVGR